MGTRWFNETDFFHLFVERAEDPGLASDFEIGVTDILATVDRYQVRVEELMRSHITNLRACLRGA